MRPLNRPMFRYGGPIKEGIMDGMREPLKNGKIVGGKQSPLLAGAHPLKDAEGREHHFLPALYAMGLGAIRAAPMVYRGIRAAGTARAPGTAGFLRNLLPTGRFRTVAGKQRSPSPEFMKGDPTAFAGGPGPSKTLGLGEALKNPFLLGKAIRENPITAFTAASTIPQAATLAGKGAIGAVKSIPDLAKGYIEAVLPGQQFSEEDEIKVTEGTGGIKRGDPNKDKVVPTPNTSGQAGDDEKQGITEDRVNEAKEKYYKLMGIDKMKKEAVYDSLIDASKIVSEEGADLKGSIKSGNLQNRIIQAISKNLDESSDLKKKIDAAVLQGEIQKDINKTKQSAFQEQLAFIRNNPDDPLAKKLSGATSVADNLAALADKPITSDVVQRLIESKGVGVKGQIKDDKYQKWEKKNEGKDEIDYLQEITKGGTLDPGIYVINKKAIRIDKDGSAFPVDLDSILG